MATQPLDNQELVHHIPLKAPADLLELALQNNAAIDVIERLAALQRDERDYRAKVSFDEALNLCQARLGRISADAHNPSTNSRYASYAKLDAIVRPIYTAEGFSVSFGERDCPIPGKTRFVGFLSRAGFTREYIKDMFPSTKGPKGNDVMTPVHADAAADSYAKRYLLKDMFNIAIGEDDTDGNPAPRAETTFSTPMHPDRVRKLCFEIRGSKTVPELRARYLSAGKEAQKFNDRDALESFMRVKDERKAELQCP